MADTDLDSLARRYFELWQTQLGGLASNHELSGSLARLLAAANAQVTAAFGGRDAGTSSPTAGTTAAASASGDSTAELRQFGERLATLERRVAELEQRIVAHGAKPARKPGRKARARQPATSKTTAAGKRR